MKSAEIQSSDQSLTPEAVAIGSKMAPVGSTLLLVRGSALHKEIRAGLVVAPVAFNQDVKALVPGPSVVPKYLTHAIRGNEANLLKLVTSAGNTAGVLDTKVVQDFEIFLPDDLDEQAALVTVFDDIEDLISSLEWLIAKKRDIKQGLMQELLTSRAHLPGFTSDWTPVTLGNVGTTYGGLAGKSSKDFGHGNGRFVTFVEVMRDARLRGTDLSPVDIKNGERQNFVRRGDVLFNGSSETPEEVALAAAVEFRARDVYLNSFCFGYRLNRSDEVDPLFLAYLFRAAPGRQLIVSLAQGSTRYNIAKTKLMSSSIELPEFAEQQAIVNVFCDADDEIRALEDRLESVCAVRQGMMQELLTGRTRLSVEEVVV